MKKVIFISALAIAAAVSCTKSDIVDTKFNEQISFETYTGRDAMTKAAVTDNSNLTEIGLYGFYTGKDPYTAASSKANLWGNEKLSKGNSGWSYTNSKYWTNDDDKYTFLAYAPYATAEGEKPSVEEGPTVATYTKGEGADVSTLTVNAGTSVVNPSLSYTVSNNLANQVDVLYSNNANPVTKRDVVSLTMQHALARLTVNAKSAEGQAFEFRVKKITINGGFITSDELTLATGSWKANSTPVAATTPGTETTNPVYPTTYTFYNETANTTALGTSNTDYAKVGNDFSNYLMMVPVNFSTQPAFLTVEYTTYYANQESTLNTATFPVNTNFEQGKAYAINLTFSKDVEAIEFTVSVENWDEGTADAEGNNPQHDNKEVEA